MASLSLSTIIAYLPRIYRAFTEHFVPTCSASVLASLFLAALLGDASRLRLALASAPVAGASDTRSLLLAVPQQADGG